VIHEFVSSLPADGLSLSHLKCLFETSSGPLLIMIYGLALISVAGGVDIRQFIGAIT
jgi:hypothetical protein